MPFFIVLILLAYQALLIFVHLALYQALAVTFGIGSVPLEALFVVLAVSFPLMSFVGFKFHNKLISAAYTASAYWFGLAHFLFGGAFAALFVEYCLYSFNHYVPPALILGPALAIVFLIHLYGTFESDRAHITRVAITLPGLPDAWRGKKAVFVSDLHLGNVHGRHFAERVVAKIKALAPEAVFVGGDMYDGVKCDAAHLVEPFLELKAPRGIYFISGNHDEFQESEKLFQAIRDVGFRILNNEKVDCGGIELVGVDYKSAHKKGDFERILAGAGVDRKRPSILLKHEPDNLPVAEAAGITLILSGHTHRGQIWPISHFTKRIYKGFDYGLKPHGSMQVYTSSGVGTWGPPLRLGTRSEIVLIEFT